MKDAARHLDKRFEALKGFAKFSRPPKGWLRAIRGALGMTTAQFARRIGVSQPRVIALEQAEAAGSITLHTLERAAEGLGCHVVYVLVPDKPLGRTLQARAEEIAMRKMRAVNQTMRLEDQAVGQKQFLKDQKQKLMDGLLEHPARLWDEK
jgi:predicted DNA-binding mobile mystery protein A